MTPHPSRQLFFAELDHKSLSALVNEILGTAEIKTNSLGKYVQGVCFNCNNHHNICFTLLYFYIIISL